MTRHNLVVSYGQHLARLGGPRQGRAAMQAPLSAKNRPSPFRGDLWRCMAHLAHAMLNFAFIPTSLFTPNTCEPQSSLYKQGFPQRIWELNILFVKDYYHAASHHPAMPTSLKTAAERAHLEMREAPSCKLKLGTWSCMEPSEARVSEYEAHSRSRILIRRGRRPGV